MSSQIRAELFHHNIRLYPFDHDDTDEEEVQLNEGIRVSLVRQPISHDEAKVHSFE